MALQEELLHSGAETLLMGIDRFLGYYGGQVDGRRWNRGKGRHPDYREEGPAPKEWMVLTLTGFADLLAAVYEGMPFRQFIQAMLNAIPASEEGKRVLTAAKMRARKRWTNLYELDCQSVGAWLRQAAATLRERQINLRDWEERSEEFEGMRIYEEMAREPVPFVYQKRRYHFPYRQSLLLSILRDLQPRSVPEVIVELWTETWRQKLPACKNRLHQLQRATNAALDRRDLPFEIGRPAANQIQLYRKTKR